MKKMKSKTLSYLSFVLAITLLFSNFGMTVGAQEATEDLGTSQGELGDSDQIAGENPTTYGAPVPVKTIHDIDFEDTAVGSTPATPPWNVRNTGAGDITVQLDPTDGTNQVLRVQSVKLSTNKFGITFPRENVYAKVSFDMYASSTKVNQGWSRVQFASYEKAQPEGHEAARVGIMTKIHHFPVFEDGETEVEIPGTSRDNWYHYELEVHVPTQTYALSMNGAVITENGDFTAFGAVNTPKSMATYVDRLIILTGGVGKSLYYLDNIKLEVSDITYVDTVTGYAPITPIEVPYGTDFAGLPLPTTVLTYTNANPAGILYPIHWESYTYNMETIGAQTIRGQVLVPNEVKHTGRTVNIEATIIVPTHIPVSITQGKFRYLDSGVDETGFIWTSETPAVATVDDQGLVTALTAGKSKIVGKAPDDTEYKYEISVLADIEELRFKELKANWMAAHSINPAIDYTHPDFAEKIEATNTKAQMLWDTMDITLTTNAGVMWETGQTTNALRMRDHFQNFNTMLDAFSYPSGDLYHNKQLFNDTIEAIDIAMVTGVAGLKFGNQAASGNWYEWQIGTPFALNGSMMLASDFLPQEKIAIYCAASMRYPNIASWNGANVAETSFSVLAPAIVTNDVAKLDFIKAQMPRSGYIVTSGNGIYPDGSYMFHNYSPYNLGYGMAFMDGALAVLRVVAGTAWSVDALNPIIVNFTRDGLVPIIQNGSGMSAFNGRGTTREPDLIPASPELASGRDVITKVIEVLPLAQPTEQAYFKQAIKHWITSTEDVYNWDSILNPNYKAEITAILGDNSIPSTRPYNGAKVYGYIDRIVQHADTYTAAVSMYSARTWNYNATNGENIKGWHTGDAMLYVYNSDTSQFGEGVYPTTNVKRLPGITVEHNVLADSQNKESRGSERWAGSSTLGNVTTTGMVLNKTNFVGSDLKAKKSYFFFEDKIVAVGSGVTSASGYEVETIIENRLIADDQSNAITINGQLMTAPKDETLAANSWVHQEGNVAGSDIGYLLLEDSGIHAEKVTGTGSFFGKLTGLQLVTPGTTVHTKNYFELYVKHGTSPTDGKYSYVILPGKTAAETQQFAESHNIKVLEQSANIHAITDGRRTMMNVWSQTGGSAGMITVNKGASVTTEINGNILKVAVSQPEQRNETIELTLDAEVVRVVSMDSGITTRVENGNNIFSANTAGLAGHSLTFTVEIIRNDNTFESFQPGEIPTHWNIVGGQLEVVQETLSNKALKLAANANAVITTPLRNAINGNEISFRYNASQTNKGALLFGTSTITALKANLSQGKLLLADGEVAFAANEWHTVQVLADEINRTATVKVDGIVLASNVPYSGALQQLSIQLPAGTVALVDDLVAKEVSLSTPTIPQALSDTDYGARYVNLTWNPSTDLSSGIVYHVYQDGVEIGTTAQTAYSAFQLEPDTSYSFTVLAENISGNRSAQSAPVVVKTLVEVSDIVVTFEAETIGGTPLGWAKTGTDLGAILAVAANPTPDAVNPSGKVLDIYSGMIGKNAVASYTFAPVTTTATFKLKALYRAKDNFVAFRIGDSSVQAVHIMTDMTGADKYIAYHKNGQGGNGRLKLMNYNAGQWYEFKVTVDVAAQTYSLWADDVPLLTDEPFYVAVSEISVFSVATPNGGVGGLYVDDILLPTGVDVTDTVTSITPSEGISVGYNTDFYAIGLPDTVSVKTILSPAGTPFKVNWNYADYNPKATGSQLIAGRVVIPANISATDPTVNITVTVGTPQTYQITVDAAVQNGTLSSSHSAATEYTLVTLTAQPDSGYQLKKLTVNGVAVTVNSNHEHLLELKENISVSAVFEVIPSIPAIYTVTIDGAIVDGTVTTSATSEDENTEIVLTVVPDLGYRLKTLNIDGSPVIPEADLTYRFLLQSSVVVSAVFEIIPINYYSVLIDSALVGGSIATSHTTAPSGTTVTITAQPNAGYKLKTLTVNGALVTPDSSLSYSFILTADTTVSAVFERLPLSNYSVLIDSTLVGGSITTSHTTAPNGTTVTITAQPDAGYKLKTLTVNGAVVTPDSSLSYSFTLSADVTISAVFERLPLSNYSVLIDSTLVGGSITTSHTTAPNGTTVTITAQPNAGYKLKTLTVGGAVVAPDTNLSYSFTLSADVTISAVFEILPITHYSVLIDPALVGGSITTSHTTAIKGTTVEITVVPNTGYVLDAIFINGIKVPPTSGLKHSFLLNDNVTVSATFSKTVTPGKDTPTVTSSRRGGGSSSQDKTSVPQLQALSSAQAKKTIVQSLQANKTVSALDIIIKSVPVLTPELIQLILDNKAESQEVRVLADSMKGNKVMGRLYIPISSLKQGASINTTISTNIPETAKVSALFKKFFAGDFFVVNLAQKGEFGAVIRVAVINELANVDAKNIVIYSYDIATNKYVQVQNTSPTIDNNGYVHFNTTAGGTFIISNGSLEKK